MPSITPHHHGIRASRTRPAVSLLAILVLVTVVTGCDAASGVVDRPGGRPSPGVEASQPASPIPPSLEPSSLEPTTSPEPTVSADPSVEPSPTPTPRPTPSGPFEMNLYRKGDFMSQATKHWCVAGAMQTMLNIGDVTNSHSKTFQAELEALATELSDATNGGTEPEGWAKALRREGLGRYVVEVAPTRTQAIHLAALAIRRTGRPVGLLVWRGAHSWVMHGFHATADPAHDPSFRVTSVWVSDPWYPRVSSIWGPSNPPNTKVKVADLKIDYLKWRRPTGRYPDKDGQYVLVVPIDR